MTPLIQTEKLGKLLTSNWVEYIDRSKLLAIVLEASRDGQFSTISVPLPPMKTGVQLSISRIEFGHDGALLWAEFQIPKNDNILITGTSEIHVSYNGEVSKVESVGRVLNYST